MSNEKRFNAEYEIIESQVIGDVELVIGYNPAAPNPYVCWYCKEKEDYYFGHYCNSLEAAQKSLYERLNKLRK